jgi:hypothetical protein
MRFYEKIRQQNNPKQSLTFSQSDYGTDQIQFLHAFGYQDVGQGYVP